MALRFRQFMLACAACVCASVVPATAFDSAQATQTPGPQRPAPPSPGQKPPAQQPTTASPVPESYSLSQMRIERVSSTHIRSTGAVEIEHASGVKFFADEADLHTDTDTLRARGNIVFTNLEGRISAERVEFNFKTQLGTFYQAAGIMSLGDKAERVQFGNQDPDVYFYGDTVAKIGERKYRITRGGFTTCVQPTPRWELTSGSVTLNLQDYALLKNTVLKVKGVPLFYFPIAYYPIQEDQRSTGFLLPSYGTSTVRGQSLSNAFFWAINRSHDATLFHDWFTNTGQGYGTEYRYVTNAQSSGNLRLYRFNQKATEPTEDVGALPDAESFEVRANATQTITRGLRARARVDYFSDVISQQLYHQNLYDASRRSRVIQGAVTGAWSQYNAGIAYDQNEVFNDEHNSVVYGSTPRINAGIAPTPILGHLVYGSLTGEYANSPNREELDGVPVAEEDFGLSRIDIAPQLRMAFSRWTFLTLNTSTAYRFTRYSESLNEDGIQVPEPYTRAYFDVRADAVGPVFTKIWDAATDSSVERYKHVIEPTFGYQQATAIDDVNRTPLGTNNSDFVVGGAMRFTYGLTNRLLRRDRPREGASTGAREFLSIAVQQTYYSDQEGSQHDPSYQSSTANRTLVSLSPVAVTVRYSPTQATTASMRMEHDVNGGGVQSLSASGNVYAGRQSVSATFSRRRFDQDDDPENFLSAGGTTSFLQGRVAANYSLSWDITKNYIVSQTVSATYFAQCCGFGVEYQKFNYPQFSDSFPVTADQRFNFSFTLAGLGTFSNFFGAFGGNTGR